MRAPASALRGILLVWCGVGNAFAISGACTFFGISDVARVAVGLGSGIAVGVLVVLLERRIREEERAKAGRRSVTFEIPPEITGEIRGVSLMVAAPAPLADHDMPSQEVH